MKQVTLIERPFYQPTYRIQSRSTVAVCSPYTNALQLFRDADDSAWETFSDASVPQYFAEGITETREHLDILADTSRTYSQEEGKTLTTMIESLLQARSLLDGAR